jgi:hypothetical protein
LSYKKLDFSLLSLRGLYPLFPFGYLLVQLYWVPKIPSINIGVLIIQWKFTRGCPLDKEN